MFKLTGSWFTDPRYPYIYIYIFSKKNPPSHYAGYIVNLRVHLGCNYGNVCLDADHSAKIEVTARIQAATKAWRSLYHTWTSAVVPLRVKCQFFVSLVQSVLLSGLVSLVLSQSQTRSLEVVAE